MKFARIIVAAVTLSLSANAYAAPEDNSQFYENRLHVFWVLFNNPGFCLHSNQRNSGFCLGI